LIKIDGNNPAFWTHELRDEQRHVTHPAADVQHAHT
jgi:hypothetical protein